MQFPVRAPYAIPLHSKSYRTTREWGGQDIDCRFGHPVRRTSEKEIPGIWVAWDCFAKSPRALVPLSVGLDTYPGRTISGGPKAGYVFWGEPPLCCRALRSSC